MEPDPATLDGATIKKARHEAVRDGKHTRPGLVLELEGGDAVVFLGTYEQGAAGVLGPYTYYGGRVGAERSASAMMEPLHTHQEAS